MKKFNLIVLLFASLMIMISTSCKKDEVAEEEPDAIPKGGNVLWKYDTGVNETDIGIYSTAIDKDENIYFVAYFGLNDERIVSIDKNGAKRWETPSLDGEFYGKIMVQDGKVYYSTVLMSQIYCLDASTGTKLWDTHISGTSNIMSGYRLALTNTRLYSGLWNQGIYDVPFVAFDLNGDEVWRMNMPFKSYVTSVTAIGTDIYVNAPIIFKFRDNGNTGDTAWSYRLVGTENRSMELAVDHADNVYFVSAYNEKYYLNCISSSGQLVWEKYIFDDIDEEFCTPTIDAQGNIYVSSKGVYKFDKQGNQIWYTPRANMKNEYTFNSGPLLTDNYIYQSDNSGIYSFDNNGDYYWEGIDTTDTAPLPKFGFINIGASGNLYVNSNTYIYCFQGDQGKLNGPWPKLHGNSQNNGR